MGDSDDPDLDRWLASLSDAANRTLVTGLLKQAMMSGRQLVDVATEHYRIVIAPRAEGAGAPCTVAAPVEMGVIARARELLDTSPADDRDVRRRTEGFLMLEAAARAGDVGALALLGRMQCTASSAIPPELQDPASGAELLRSAAERGSIEAQLDLARALDTGEGAWRDAGEAVHWYRLAAGRGDVTARDRLLEIWWSSGQPDADPADVLRLTREAAGSGHAEAAYRLGRALRFGLLGCESEPAGAFAWFERAAAAGETRARYHLGEMCFLGEGVEQDRARALEHFRLSTTFGSHYFLGVFARDGLAGPVDTPEAHQQFQIAACPGDLTIGDRRAQHAFGRLHQEGKCSCGESAAFWYEQSAEKGWPDAQHDLGWLHEHGVGVPGNLDEAVRWYEEAAQNGHATAAATLVRLRGVAPS